jgi:hypothetical protein
MVKHKKKFKKIDLHKFVPKTAHQATVHGNIEYIGKPREGKVSIDLVQYDENNANEFSDISLKDLEEKLGSPLIKWIRINL